MVKLEWKNIIFENISHRCEKCLECSSEYEWKRNLIKGEWIRSNLEIDPYQVRGFIFQNLYSPFQNGKVNYSENLKKPKETNSS